MPWKLPGLRAEIRVVDQPGALLEPIERVPCRIQRTNPIGPVLQEPRCHLVEIRVRVEACIDLMKDLLQWKPALAAVEEDVAHSPGILASVCLRLSQHRTPAHVGIEEFGDVRKAHHVGIEEDRAARVSADLGNQPAVIAELGEVAVLDPQRQVGQHRFLVVVLDRVVRAVDDIEIERAAGVLPQRMDQCLPFEQAGFTGSDEHTYCLRRRHVGLPGRTRVES